MGNVAVPDIAAIQKKYAERAGSAGSYYESGVKNPSKDWAGAAEAGVPNLKAAVSASNFGAKVISGIKKAGSAKWQKRAVDLGVGRYPTGVAAGANDFGSGIAPYMQALSGATLPDRKPRGDPANQQRSAAVSTLLAQKRISMASAGV